MVSSQRGIFIILLSFSAIVPARAQTPPSDPPPDAAAPAAAPSRALPIAFGVRFGPSFTSLSSVEPFDDTAAAAAVEPTLNFGVFVNLGLGGALSFQPEILFASKGERIRDKDAQPAITPSGELKLPPADRVILVRYLELPLLLRLSKQTHENTSLYLIAGPAIALRRSAVIRQVVDAGRHEDIEEQVNGIDFSYIFGAGVQHRRWLMDARFTRGMRNIASDPDPSPVKTGAFAVLLGTRF